MKPPRLPLVLLAACAARAPADTTTLPEPVCPGPSAGVTFVERTDAWGLRGVAGIRLTLTDLDGDGYPDLHTSRASDTPDDFGPDGARVTWLLHNDGGRGFSDVTEASGLRAARRGDGPRPGQVVAWADVDNDGDLDAYTGLNHDGSGEHTSEILLNDGDGTFTLAPTSPLRRPDEDHPAAATFVDVDRDGTVDLWLPQAGGRQDELFRGAGDGTFRRHTPDAGLLTGEWGNLVFLNTARAHSNAWSGAACDVNDDGRPDLLAASYGRAPNHLWTQQADGTFTNDSLRSGYAFDNRTDWTDNESARCWCLLHPDDDDCEGVSTDLRIGCEEDADAFRWRHTSDREPYRLGGNSGTTVCADVDNDGDRDLLTTEIVHWDVGSSSDPSELLFNDGTGAFTRPGNDATGLIRPHDRTDWNDGDITAAAFDADNDGWLDLWLGSTDYPGTRGTFFRQTAPGQFERLDPADNLDVLQAQGVVVGDLDRDGDLDLIIGHSPNRCPDLCDPTGNVRAFENLAGGTFLQLDLVGTGGSNAAAIGARVRVTARGVTQTRDVDGGHGHYGSQHDRIVHVGLGDACEAEVEVRWPDAAGTVTRATLPAGHRFRWVQGEAPVVVP